MLLRQFNFQKAIPIPLSNEIYNNKALWNGKFFGRRLRRFF